VTQIICGIDVSPRTLYARIGPQVADGCFANTAEDIAELTAFCLTHSTELVAMEAKGGYEQLPFALLWEQGLPTAILNPRAVRRFAEGIGLLEKTDHLDAGVIARFAATRASSLRLRLRRHSSGSRPWSRGCGSSPSCRPRRAICAAWFPSLQCCTPFSRC
jgi:transposase